MTRIAIIGAGQGGRSLLQIFSEDPSIKVIGVADRKSTAPGIKLAKSLKVPTYSDYRTLLEKKIDIIFNVTGSALEKELEAYKEKGAEVISGLSAKLTWALIEEKRKSQQRAEELLAEYLSLYDLSVKLSTNDNLTKLYSTVIDYATHLTRTPAGSLAMFDEERGEMILVASGGLSRKFSLTRRWKVRKGGLTSQILNQKGPFVVEKLTKHPKYNNPVLLAEGVKSLAAISLWSEGKILGILYVDDFKPRAFTGKEISLLQLISTIAATTIEKAKIFEKTRMMAITDELTGLFNHRHFLNQLSTELSRTKRYSRPLTLVMIDIDHFKHYNDTYGHLQGNEILRTLGEIMRKNIRDTDIPARYGGEEFSIIMPETTRQRAKSIAERLRKAISAHRFRDSGRKLGSVTVSLGIASYPENASSIHNLIEEADQALYKAKELGRNRICLSNSSAPRPSKWSEKGRAATR